jgi:hypothetical protein
MSAPDTVGHTSTRSEYGTIIVVGGGCYGGYYVRQLARAREAGALSWERVVVVDSDPDCAVQRSGELAQLPGGELEVSDWREFFARYLTMPGDGDAVVPSPLMPHLMYEWLLERARARWPTRTVATKSLEQAPSVPWERGTPDGTHYVSFAEWMCPINCVEPPLCPHIRGPRTWSMPRAMRAYVAAERERGRPLVGPVIFHCSHRAYGVGMFDVADVVAADALVRDAGELGPADVLVGTVSHCHGALNLLAIGA